jgi:hypothetical protein
LADAASLTTEIRQTFLGKVKYACPLNCPAKKIHTIAADLTVFIFLDQ